jgi:hypothetical protein
MEAPELDTISASAGLIDAMRVVPVHAPEAETAAERGLPAGPPRKLVYGGGRLLTAVEVITVFWGAPWQQAPLAPLANQINQFFDFILTSALIDQLAEYNVPQYKINHGRRTGTFTVTAPSPGLTVSDTRARRFVQQEIKSGTLPKPDANSLYFLYLPPGTVSVMQGRSCQTFCGYHNDVGGNLFYAVMPYPGCTGCRMSLTVLDSLTTVSSHELCESITDPIPGLGWYDQSYGEIGDLCVGQTKKVGQYTVQQEWSNQASGCA